MEKIVPQEFVNNKVITGACMSLNSIFRYARDQKEAWWSLLNNNNNKIQDVVQPNKT